MSNNTKRRETLAARLTVASPLCEGIAPALPRLGLSPRVLWGAAATVSAHAGGTRLQVFVGEAVRGVERYFATMAA